MIGFNDLIIKSRSFCRLSLVPLSIITAPPTIRANVKSAMLTAPLSIQSLICGKKFDIRFVASFMAFLATAEKKSNNSLGASNP